MITLKIEGMDELKKLLDPKLIAKAEPRALNKTAKLSRTAESREIRKVYNIKASRLNRELEKISGGNRATVNRPRAIIRGKKLTKRNPGLQNYGARQTAKGVSYRVRKDLGRKTMPHAFVATMPEGGTGIFLRSSKKKIMTKGRYVGKKRALIRRKVGPSVVQMMESIGIKPISTTVEKNFPRIFSHEYNRELLRAKR